VLNKNHLNFVNKPRTAYVGVSDSRVGKTSDNRNPLANAVYEAGSLRLQDLGYFNLERMKQQAARGEYWISRYQLNTAIYDNQGLLVELLQLLYKLKQAGVTQYECPVEKSWLVGHSNSANPWRRLCELYVKLLIVVVQHWLFLTGLWDIPDRSLIKGGQMIKEQAAGLAAYINDIDDLTQLLQEIAKRFQVGCRQNKRKNHHNTWRQLLDGVYVFS